MNEHTGSGHGGCAVLALAGRVLLALIFVIAGFGKLTHITGTAQSMAGAGLPFADLLVWPAAILEFASGVLLLVGWQARWAALVLVIFIAVASYYFHPFWAMTPEQASMQQIMFMKNLAIIGGLLMVAAHGPGRMALGRS